MGGGESFQDWEAYSHCKGRGGKAGEKRQKTGEAGEERAGSWGSESTVERGHLSKMYRGALCFGREEGTHETEEGAATEASQASVFVRLSLLFAISLNNNQRQENHSRSSVSQE